MPTYDNPRTGVVHWIPLSFRGVWWIRTACHHLDSEMPQWNRKNFDRAGVTADVTCYHCHQTVALAADEQTETDDLTAKDFEEPGT